MKKLKLTICLCCVMLAAGINSCKKELTNPFGTANNSTALALTQLSSGQKIQASEMFTWFQSVSPYLKIKPLWDKAEQTVLNGDQVIMVPINNHTALFFTKVNGILNVSAYKWSGKKPVDAKFSGKVAAFSFQSYSFKAYVFKKGKVVKFDTLSLVSTFQPTSSGVSVSGKSVSGTKTLSSTGETTTTVVSQLSHPSINRPKNLSLFGNIFNDIGCWLQGGSVIPGDEDGCYIVEGDSLWDRIAGFFANLFGVGDNVGTPNDNTQNWTTGVITDPDGSTGEVTTSSTEGVYIIVNSPCNTRGMPPPAGPPQDPNSPPDPGDGGGDSGDPCVSTNTQWVPIDYDALDTYTGDNDDDPDDDNTIDPGPTSHIPSQITLNNGQVVSVIFGTTADGVSADQPISNRLLNLLIQGLNSSGGTITSIYVKATTNGTHSIGSNHSKGLAIDISRINGVPISISGVTTNVLLLQVTFDLIPNIRENFGPYWLHKLGQPFPSAPPHTDHIHISVNAN